MRTPLARCKKWLLMACMIAIASSFHVVECRGNSFGINFGGDGDAWGGWGPHYVNQVGAHGSGPYVSAFDVLAADWYEPGSVSQTVQLPGSPTNVNFKPASMGAGSVDIAWESAHPGTGPQDGYTFIPYGFANANRFVMEVDEFGDPILDQDGHYIPVDPQVLAPDNGIPPSGEYAVLSGALFATDGVEYAPDWPQGDIVVTISGLSSIASGYTVKLLAAAQNGDVVEAFTSASIADNASNSDMVDFTLLPDRPSYWSPFDPDPLNPFVSVAGEAESTTTFTGDSLEIRLTGPNEGFNDEFAFTRTVLAGVVIDYDPLSQPELSGDYNSDNKVDAADYVIWRDNNGSSNPLPNDNMIGGVVGQAHYDLWRDNFGMSDGQMSGLAQVPEPSSCISAALFAAILLGRYRPQKKYSFH